MSRLAFAVIALVCAVVVVAGLEVGSDDTLWRWSSRSGPKAIPGVRAPNESWVEQPLDHFDAAEERTWLQRYFENDDFYVEGGPVFVMVGFEGTAGLKPEEWLQGGQMMELAQVNGAKAFLIEQRFFGESKPTVDVSVESFQYFTPLQSLADIAAFITEQRANHPGAKVIIFGGSFGGNLAAWTRLKHPQLVDGAVISSAPILASLEYPQFFEEVGLVMEQADPACLNDMRAALQATGDLFASENGTLIMAELFDMCAPIDADNKMDIMNFNLIYADIYAAEAQKARSIDDMLVYCDYITNPIYGETPLDRLVTLTENFYPAILPCAEIRYEPYKNIFSNTAWSGFASTTNRRQYVYQTCAWHGDFTTSNSPIQPFGDVFRADIFEQICKDYFDEGWETPALQASIDALNADFGGLQPPLTNTVFVQGTFDPWRLLGVREDISATATSIVIEGSSHITDMETSEATDSPQLVAARAQIRDLVSQWIQ